MGLKKVTVEKEKQQKMLQVESQEVDESNKKKSLQKLHQRMKDFELRSNLQIVDAIVYEWNEQLQKLLCSTAKILKGRRSNLHNRRLLLDLRGKENVVMIWQGVGEKNKKLKKKDSPPPISHANHRPHSPT